MSGVAPQRPLEIVLEQRLSEIALLGTFVSPDAIVSTAALDERIASVECGGWLRMRDTITGQVLQQRNISPREPTCLHVEPSTNGDGNLWIGCSDGTLLVFDRQCRKISECILHEAGVTAIVAHAGVLWSAGSDGRLAMWECRSMACLRCVVAATGPVNCVAPCGPGHVVTNGDNGALFVWSADTLRQGGGDPACVAAAAHHGAVLAAIQHRGNVWTGGEDGVVQVHSFDGHRLRRLHVLQGHDAPVHCLASEPAGSRVWSTSLDGALVTWDGDRYALSSRLPIAFPPRAKHFVFHVAPVAAALAHRVWCCGTDGTVRCWLSLAPPPECVDRSNEMMMLEIAVSELEDRLLFERSFAHERFEFITSATQSVLQSCFDDLRRLHERLTIESNERDMLHAEIERFHHLLKDVRQKADESERQASEGAEAARRLQVQLQFEIARLTDECLVAQRDARHYQTSIEELRSSLAALEQSKENERIHARRALAEAQEDADRIQQALRQSQLQNEELKEQRDDIQRALQRARERQRNYELILEEERTKCKATATQLRESESVQSSLQAQVDALTANMTTLEQRRADEATRHETLVATLRSQCEEYQNRWNATSSVERQLSESLRETERREHEIRTRLTEVTRERDEAREALREAVVEVEQMSNALRSESQATHALHAELSQEKQRSIELTSQLEERERNHARVVWELNSAFEQSTREKSVLFDRCRELEGRLGTLSADLSDAKRTADKSILDATESTKEVSLLRAQLHSSQELIESLNAALTAERRRVAELNDSVQNLNATVERERLRREQDGSVASKSLEKSVLQVHAEQQRADNLALELSALRTELEAVKQHSEVECRRAVAAAELETERRVQLRLDSLETALADRTKLLEEQAAQQQSIVALRRRCTELVVERDAALRVVDELQGDIAALRSVKTSQVAASGSLNSAATRAELGVGSSSGSSNNRTTGGLSDSNSAARIVWYPAAAAPRTGPFPGGASALQSSSPIMPQPQHLSTMRRSPVLAHPTAASDALLNNSRRFSAPRSRQHDSDRTPTSATTVEIVPTGMGTATHRTSPMRPLVPRLAMQAPMWSPTQ